MSLTGKTIDELNYLQFPTNETKLPVESSGDTYHISFSSITYNEGTYSQFVTDANNGVLTPGRFYLMTDYQTCYDQPNYNNFRDAITTDNYMTSNTEPILLLAISTTGFSPTVYSTLYPQDKITYDITWNTTEITLNPAKGRITERIDNFNNRTDYDHRTILFKRYAGYSYFENQPLGGLVGISGLTGTTGVLYGNTGTTFNSNLTTGSFVSIPNLNPKFFEVISIESDSLAIISGVTISETTDSYYYYAYNDGVISYYQPNIRNDEFFEYTTFNYGQDVTNNYIGNHAIYYEFFNEFILANNVFRHDPTSNNTIGNRSYNNTFNDLCRENQIGDRFFDNSIHDDFVYNTIEDDFVRNYITSIFAYNRIGKFCSANILLGDSFNRNDIGNNFTSNVWVSNEFSGNKINEGCDWNKLYNYFYNNNIGYGFHENVCYSFIGNNLIGNGFNGNTIRMSVDENTIGVGFYRNTIGDDSSINLSFTENSIGDYFNLNYIGFSFFQNNILNGFKENNLYWEFTNNSILYNFRYNTIGIVGSGNDGNIFKDNQIMNTFQTNNIQGNFNSNLIKSKFRNNSIFPEFNNNNVGEDFYTNNLLYHINAQITHNNIGDNFQYNTSYGSFSYNTIGTNFSSNNVQDGFGFGNATYQGNKIGNNFMTNQIGEYFYNNTIPDNFISNTIGDYFQWNIVDTYIDGIDFTPNYGNITGITYSATGNTSTDGVYVSVGGVTNGKGLFSLFTIDVNSGGVFNVTILISGVLYVVGDTITILGSQIGGTDGVDDVIITVTGINQKPSVYEPYTCNIFKNSILNNRLSYYDENDTLTIKGINQ